MDIIRTPAYQKAFIRYLRKGTPIELSLKAEHPTTHYIWRTAGDGKVRASHAVNEGRIFSWDKTPPTGHPGEDYNCRCTAEPFYGHVINDPPLEPVYPELLIIPLLRVPRLAAAWRAWVLQRRVSKEWKLGSHKSAVKWRNRLEKGDWSPEKITKTIREGKAYRAPNKPFPKNTATGYELDGKFVVVDDVTNDIIQISRPGQVPEILP